MPDFGSFHVQNSAIPEHVFNGETSSRSSGPAKSNKGGKKSIVHGVLRKPFNFDLLEEDSG